MEENKTYKPFAYRDHYSPIEDEIIYYNTEKTLNKIKNDCAQGSGSSETLVAEANKFISVSSVSDANEQAEEWLNVNSQAYANNLGTCVIDSSPPTSVVLSANSITSDSLTLLWTVATDNIGIVAYDIFIDDTFIGSTASNVFTYDITELSTSTTYNFYVKAKDDAGNTSTSNLLTVDTLPVILKLTAAKSVIFENRNSNWSDCRNATAAATYYQSNNYLGAAKDSSEFILNRYRGVIDTSSIKSKPKSAKLKFKFAVNSVGNPLTFNLFSSNILISSYQDFQLIDWDDWDSTRFLGSRVVPVNSTEYQEIALTTAQLDLLNFREGFNFFLISNGDKDNNAPSGNSRPILSITADTGEVYLECEF